MSNKLTDLDRLLQEMALTNWPQFVALVGPDAILRAKTCLLRTQGKSYGQIQQKLDMSEKQVRYASEQCRRCNDE